MLSCFHFLLSVFSNSNLDNRFATSTKILLTSYSLCRMGDYVKIKYIKKSTTKTFKRV